tara:strand:+ start:11151 stop:12233 length:1083 start_codon:yes stop_codon:yes gene_type:complete
MSKKIIKEFLLDKGSYQKCGVGRIADAIFQKKGIIATASDIKEVKKEIKKDNKKVVEVDEIKITPQLIEDFRNMAEKLNIKLSGTAFAPTESKIELKRKKTIKDYSVPDFSDQKGMHIILGCNHVPFHHVQLHEGIKALIVDYKKDVKGFHLIGDFMDINTLSSHDKGRFTAIPGLTLDDEYSAGNELLDEFDAILPKDVWKTYLYGNHEDRHNRWMRDMQNAKTPLDSPEEALGLWKRGYQVKTNWSQDYFTLGKNFDIFHGIYFSIHCAKAHLDKLRRSCAFAHTHRVQTYREGDMAAYNIGSCADYTSSAFGYATRPMKAQWSNGFAINMIDSKGNSHVTTVVPDKDGHFWFGGKMY